MVRKELPHAVYIFLIIVAVFSAILFFRSIYFCFTCKHDKRIDILERNEPRDLEEPPVIPPGDPPVINMTETLDENGPHENDLPPSYNQIFETN